MTERTDPRRRVKRPRRGVLVALVLAGLVAGVLGGVFPFRQMFAHHRQVDAAEQQLADLQASNADLEAEIAKLQSPVEIERIAREEFGLVRPGERSYVVETPEEVIVVPADEPDPESGEDAGFWQGIWDFLTGRDLERDG
jgi:cell division protein FtsB